MGRVRGQERYLETEILSSSQEELIVKIFDGLIQFTRIAIDKLKNDPAQIEIIHNNLRKAQRACSLLMGSLNFEAAEELSRNLFSVYEFWHHELMNANLRQDYSRIEKILPSMIEYRTTWNSLVDQSRSMRAQGKAPAEVIDRVG